MADKVDGLLAGRLLAVIEAEHLSGSPVTARNAAGRQETARAVMRRWHSFSRRFVHPERATHAERVEDLAKGLRDRSESEPTLTGPLTADYRHLAAVLADPPTD